MEYLIKALRSLIPSVDLYDKGTEDINFPYVSYEYNSITFENQYQILFSMDVCAKTSYEAETIATTIRKTLHNKRHHEEEVGFIVTQSPTIEVIPDQRKGVYSRRLNFTIVAYFKEEI